MGATMGGAVSQSLAANKQTKATMGRQQQLELRGIWSDSRHCPGVGKGQERGADYFQTAPRPAIAGQARERLFRLLLRDPFISPCFQHIQRQGASVQNFVMEFAHYELRT